MRDLRELTEADLDAVQALMERCRDYHVLTTGAGAKATAARDVWELPPQTPRTAKLTLGVYETGFIGVVDVVRCWPRRGTWLIGLLLLEPDSRRRGVGARVVAAIDARAADAGTDTLRVAVVDSNPMALAFWRRLGVVEVPAMLCPERSHLRDPCSDNSSPRRTPNATLLRQPPLVTAAIALARGREGWECASEGPE